MDISSVGHHAHANAVKEFSGVQGHRHEQRNIEGDAESIGHGEGEHHHGHHGGRGNGFGYGHFAMGMGRFIHEQMRAARREVSSEQIGEAADELTAKVAGMIGAAGQTPGIVAAQESFTTAIQDVVDRFDSGEIGRRRVMTGFRAAFEDLVGAVGAASEGDEPRTDEVVAGEANIGDINPDAASVTGAVATNDADEGVSLVENLGQVFNSFMQGMRSELAALNGMRAFMSPENRNMMFEAFVDMYRELAGVGAQESDIPADSAGFDQLA